MHNEVHNLVDIPVENFVDRAWMCCSYSRLARETVERQKGRFRVVTLLVSRETLPCRPIRRETTIKCANFGQNRPILAFFEAGHDE